MLAEALLCHDPPARRLPPLALARLLADATECVVEGRDGLLRWRHRAFQEAAGHRYLGESASRARTYAALADFWCGRWAREPKRPLRLAKLAATLEAVSCGAPSQPACFGSRAVEDAPGAMPDGPPHLRLLAEKALALLSLLAELRSGQGVLLLDREHYRHELEDALTDPVFDSTSLGPAALDPYGARRLRLLGWLRACGAAAVTVSEGGPLAPLFARLRERALEVADAEGGAERVRCLTLVAGFLQVNARGQEALPLLLRAMSIVKSTPGHSEMISTLHALASLYRTLGRIADACVNYEKALAIHERVQGPEHYLTGCALNDLAHLYNEMDRRADAIPLFERALSIAEKAYGPEHIEIGTQLLQIAGSYRAVARLDDALAVCLRAVGVMEAAVGDAHPITGASLVELAGLYVEMGRPEDALKAYERALAICEKALGPDHPDTGCVLRNLASVLENVGRHSDALPMQKRALMIAEKALGPDHVETTAVWLWGFERSRETWGVGVGSRVKSRPT